MSSVYPLLLEKDPNSQHKFSSTDVYRSASLFDLVNALYLSLREKPTDGFFMKHKKRIWGHMFVNDILHRLEEIYNIYETKYSSHTGELRVANDLINGVFFFRNTRNWNERDPNLDQCINDNLTMKLFLQVVVKIRKAYRFARSYSNKNRIGSKELDFITSLEELNTQLGKNDYVPIHDADGNTIKGRNGEVRKRYYDEYHEIIRAVSENIKEHIKEFNEREKVRETQEKQDFIKESNQEGFTYVQHGKSKLRNELIRKDKKKFISQKRKEEREKNKEQNSES